MEKQPPTAWPGEGRRILVVDPHRDSCERLAEFLEVQGHSVCTACDGVEALIEAGKFPPEIAFLVLDMPRMDGFELCARLRANTATQDSAVFALSAGVDDSRMGEHASVRFDAYLCKPLEFEVIDALVSCVDRMLLSDADQGPGGRDHRVPPNGDSAAPSGT